MIWGNELAGVIGGPTGVGAQEFELSDRMVMSPAVPTIEIEIYKARLFANPRDLGFSGAGVVRVFSRSHI